MAKTRFTVELTGLDDFVNDLGVLANEFPAWTKEALKARMQVVEDAIRAKWVSLGGGRVGDYVYDSVGMNIEYGKNGVDIVGYVGVFHLDHVAILHGRIVEEGKRKPMRAPQIAYWVEFGTQRLKGGGRKVDGAEYPEEELAKAVAGKPFITNAGYRTVSQQEQAFVQKFDQILNTHLR